MQRGQGWHNEALAGTGRALRASGSGFRLSRRGSHGRSCDRAGPPRYPWQTMARTVPLAGRRSGGSGYFQFEQRNIHRAGNSVHSLVVAREHDSLAVFGQIRTRRQMQGVEGAHRTRAGKASSARASTDADSSSIATRPVSQRAASPYPSASPRARSRAQISYSSRRLENRVSSQSEPGG